MDIRKITNRKKKILFPNLWTISIWEIGRRQKKTLTGKAHLECQNHLSNNRVGKEAN